MPAPPLHSSQPAYYTIGYYLAECGHLPDYHPQAPGRLLTASHCFCRLHPDLTACYWNGWETKKEPYQQKTGLSDEALASLSQHLSTMEIDSDSRFERLADAQYIQQTYFPHRNDIHLISISLTAPYRDKLSPHGPANHITKTLCTQKLDGGRHLGNDILGWDIGSFHTYLCNGLEQDIAAIHPLRLNTWGLIDNPYEEVETYAELIQNQGEPVIWLPVAVHLHDAGYPAET
ncbi:hypothetical protein ICN84_00525 [Akkermansia glycaniphila]|uniref:hypothetical protein n=1 Tax=Akkermansia glycaniphila TaxID=1679444 RepID=UPI001C0133CC|nr:hypothetical protein [Akkermansia glycaniphila]MBT9448555.1 hypothetical protein [Akkermansia glycaniphila]